MESYLYTDLYAVEDVHWWHVSKRAVVKDVLWNYFFCDPGTTSDFSSSCRSRLALLDVGCGAGKNLEELSKYVRAFGIDPSTEAVSFCKKRGLQRVYQAKAEQLPFTDNSFDIVLMLDVLEHIDESALTEIRRVLKPNGMLLITVPAFQWLWSKWDEVLHHRRRYTATSLRTAVVRHGFSVQKISYLYAFLVLPVWVIRKIKTNLSHGNYQSDFSVGSGITNILGNMIAALERWVFWKTGLPIGTSVVGIFRKVAHGKK